MRKKAVVSLSYQGRRYSCETDGNSVFEIAANALVHFVQNGYVPATKLAEAELHVQIETVYRVKAERIHQWLGEPVNDDFRLQLVKQQIWRAMTRRG